MTATGSDLVQPASASAAPAFDCFYVYPTVSTEPGTNADLTVQRAERAAAVSQASRFSGVCRVYAPMYRQVTLHALAGGLATNPAAITIAYQSLLAAWRDYLAHDNNGRPTVFIGHSQGAAMLIRLLQAEIDPNPTLRGQLMSAIILGGNVTVATGQATGGTFQHLPACTRTSEFGCVIAYSTFPTAPPPGSLFGRPGQGVSLMSDQPTTSGVQVLCVNPAALGGGTAGLDPYFLSTGQHVTGVTTRWVDYPNLYSATCENSGGAAWLQVTPVGTPGDTRPRVTQSLGPLWGFHRDDVNLALGNLVNDVTAQETAYRTAHNH